MRFWGEAGTSDIQKKPPRLGWQDPCTYANSLIYEVSGHLDLRREPPDGEYPQVGVGTGRGVPLKLHVRSRLLVYALDVLAPCGREDRYKDEQRLQQTPSLELTQYSAPEEEGEFSAHQHLSQELS